MWKMNDVKLCGATPHAIKHHHVVWNGIHHPLIVP